MQHRHCFEAVHRTLCDLRNNDHLFGGVPTVFGGDFAQILPVVKRGRRSDTVGATLRQSEIWSKIQTLFLTQNMRLGTDTANTAFANWIRDLSYRDDLYGQIQLPNMVQHIESLKDLCDFVFPPNKLRVPRPSLEFYSSRAILSIRNADVIAINDMIMRTIPRPARTFISIDKIDDATVDTTAHPEQNGENVAKEILASMTPNGLPPAGLVLKVGTPIMLLRNISPHEGLCNGTRLLITNLDNWLIKRTILGGTFHGKSAMIPRIITTSNQGDAPWVIQRKQYPVRPSFAITINKSQGQSLGTVGVDLRTSAFTHG